MYPSAQRREASGTVQLSTLSSLPSAMAFTHSSDSRVVLEASSSLASSLRRLVLVVSSAVATGSARSPPTHESSGVHG